MRYKKSLDEELLWFMLENLHNYLNYLLRADSEELEVE